MSIELSQKFLEESTGTHLLFNHLKDVSFFMKDHNFKIVRANQHFYERLGFREESEILGKDDFELFPKPLAKNFRKDDEKVLNTSEAMLGLVELFLNRQGLPDWYITNKLPVMNGKRKVIGVMGTVQRLDQKDGLATSDELVAGVIARMHENPGNMSPFAEIAKSLNLSHRQLDRRFKDATGLNPQKFLNKKRIELACEKLRSHRNQISDIAIDLGYCDQSAFTAQFRQCMGMTPRKYRSEFRK